jgi:histidine ammonia-lyase
VTGPAAVVLDAAPPSIDDVLAVARGAGVVLGPVAVDRIVAGRTVVDRLVNGPDLVYGLNTGLGHMRDMRVEVDVLRAYQETIVRAHDGGLGAPLPTIVVRAAMFVRLAGIARGGSGAALASAQQLAAMLSAGVHPVVPEIGSVGAADLMHLAAIAQVMIGGGQAEVGGAIVPGAEALQRAGLRPLVLEPKEGLALVSANGVSVGWAALVVARARRIAAAADLVLAASIEATRGNPSIVDPVAIAAKPVPGQTESAAAIRSFLEGSDRWTAGGADSVQDPLSFRVGPQVHGAFRETLGVLAANVDAELAASDDNPLVVAAENRMISNGNFHPIAMALAADALRPAIAHVAQLSDRRMNHLWSRLFADPSLSAPGGLDEAAAMGGPLLRYAAAARAAELRSLANPVTLDVSPLDLGVEDHATNAPLAVRRTDEALDRLLDVLSVELLIAADLVRRGADAIGQIGRGAGAGLRDLAALIGAASPIPNPAALHLVVREALLGRVLEAAEAAGGLVRQA